MRKRGMWMIAAAAMALSMLAAAPGLQAQAGGDTVLKPADMARLLPDKVFYRGQSATTQLRNSGGIKFADGMYVLATMVDTSGYSTDVQAKYQAYFIAEVPVKLGGQTLGAGVYGIGFVGDQLLVTDVGAHDVLSVPSIADPGMKRPTPMQVMADPAGGFRLYALRRYVVITR